MSGKEEKRKNEKKEKREGAYNEIRKIEKNEKKKKENEDDSTKINLAKKKTHRRNKSESSQAFKPMHLSSKEMEEEENGEVMKESNWVLFLQDAPRDIRHAKTSLLVDRLSTADYEVLADNFSRIDIFNEGKISRRAFAISLGELARKGDKVGALQSIFNNLNNLGSSLSRNNSITLPDDNQGISFEDLLFSGFTDSPDNIKDISGEKFFKKMAVFIVGTSTERLRFSYDMISGKEGISKERLGAVINAAHSALRNLGISIPPSKTEEFVNGLYEDLLQHSNNKPLIKFKHFRQTIKANPRKYSSLGLYPPPTDTIDSLRRIGTVINFGSENWNVMLNMITGVRHCIIATDKLSLPLSSPSHLPPSHYSSSLSFPLLSSGYGGQNVVESLITTVEGLEAHLFVSFAPSVFHSLRHSSLLSDSSFLSSFGPEQLVANLLFGHITSLSCKQTDGKSGSFFFSTYDGNYLFKTLYRREMVAFQRILPEYYCYMMENPESVINRIFGFHRLGTIPFVILHNVFQTKLPIHEVFDLKGSQWGRSNPEGKGVLKDLDFGDRKIKLPAEVRSKLLAQISQDTLMLERLELIDYSLLLGIHYKERYKGKYKKVRSSVRVPYWREHYGGILSSDGDVIYFVGIIDYLTLYGKRKTAETFIRSTFLNQDINKISSVPPPQYGQRFRDYIHRIIIE